MTDPSWGIPPQPAFRSGEESISGTDATLRDVWAWSMSDLRTNTVRPMVAEFLVAKALGAGHRPRVEWDSHDVETSDGLRIEVKSSAYLQAWRQSSLSRIVLSGLTARTWNPATDYSDARSYNADGYVFALHTATEHSAYDALDTRQREFWVLPVDVVAETGKRSLGLDTVRSMGGPAVPYRDLAERVRNDVRRTPRPDGVRAG